MKTNLIALVVSQNDLGMELKETLHDESEVELFQYSFEHGSKVPLEEVYRFRAERRKKDDEFADYVEELLNKPYLKKEVQDHAVQWFRSRIKIENYQKIEEESAMVIAQYAYQIFLANGVQRDFLLAGDKASIRVRVFLLPNYSDVL